MPQKAAQGFTEPAHTDSYSSKEFANFLQKSHAWVRTTLKRLRQSLKQYLHQLGENNS